MARPQKISLAEMRESGARRIVVFCSDYKCGNAALMDADCWPANLRLSDIEELLVCRVCGKRGADVRPSFPDARMGH